MTNQRRGRPDEIETGARSQPAQPAIPDGGLGAGMPEWLQQTPSWKRTPEAAPVRSLPAPDTSPIDPRRLIEIDDLPEWLRALSSREKETSPAAPRRQDESGAAVSVPAPRVAGASSEGRVRNLAPPRPEPVAARETDVTLDRSAHVPLTDSPPVLARPWWLSDAAIGILFAAIILTVIYVVLAASDVI